MIQTFSTNKQNDIFLDENGNISLITGIDAVAQACENAAKAQFDEIIYASTSGIPNMQTIWRGGEPNIDQFDASLRKAFLSVQDVIEVKSLNISVQKNTLSYEAVINTVYGVFLSTGIGA